LITSITVDGSIFNQAIEIVFKMKMTFNYKAGKSGKF
jgi:hypothetical protein